jgi:hypothetical protein
MRQPKPVMRSTLSVGLFIHVSNSRSTLIY